MFSKENRSVTFEKNVLLTRNKMFRCVDNLLISDKVLKNVDIV